MDIFLKTNATKKEICAQKYFKDVSDVDLGKKSVQPSSP